MEFLSASLLWGLGAAALPALIHLLGRTKPILHQFPALRFILRSQRSSSRALRLKHILLLLLRMAAIGGAAFALARPLLGGEPVFGGWIGGAAVLAALSGWALYRREFATSLAGVLLGLCLYCCYPGEGTQDAAALRGDFVLIMDQSMSMSYVEPEATRFELARRQALEFLDRLAPDARVALILATEKAERAPGRLTYRHEVVRQKLLDASATGCGLDLAAALQAAREILQREGQAATAAAVLCTDLQATTISALLAQRAVSVGDGRQKAPTLPLVVADVGSEQAHNGAALSGQLPGSVVPAEATATLSGKVRPVDKTHPCLVELYVDERRVAQKLVDPKGQETVDVELEFQSGRAGMHRGRLHLPDSDRLPMDQDFMFVYEAGRPASALIVEAPRTGDAKSTAFFLQAALQPQGQERALGMSGLTCTVEPPGELTPQKLAPHRVVILADCGPLGDASWAALQHWTSQGGGLFVWLGPNADLSEARRYGFQAYAKHAGLLPGNILSLATVAKPESIGVAQPESPALAHATPSVIGLLGEVQVLKFVRVRPDARDQDCNVVLQLSDGSPLLLEKAYGRGRVVLCATGPGLESSDLPKRGEAFVTLALDCVRLLAGGDSETKARLGFPLVLTLPAPPSDGVVQWLKPGAGTPVNLRVDTSARPLVQSGPAEGAGSATTVIVPALDVPGVHEFRWFPAEAKTPLVKLVAVNPDTGESDLTKATREEALRAFGGWDATIVRRLTRAPLLGGGADGGAGKREIAAGVLVALLGLLLAESFLANRLYRAEVEAEETAAASSAATAGGSGDGAA